MSPILFVICCALAAGVVLLASLVAPDWTPPPPQPPDLASLAPQPIAPAPETLAMGVVAERPLFVPGRRPPPPPAVEAPPAAPQADPFAEVELVGLFGSGDRAGVILKVGPDVHRVQQGSTWEGWRLKSVSDREAFFASEGQRDRALSLALQPQQGGMLPELEPPAEGEPAEPEAPANEAMPPVRQAIPQSSAPPPAPGRRPPRSAARS
ncbi:MAG TPA: hypothetical protein PLN31_05905 [Azoarcus taiwanensis]|nr:hypothetical protein [Azoarcus taiwanensis]